MSAVALDFSFKDLPTINDVASHTPRSRPDIKDIGNIKKRVQNGAVKLNNNKFPSANGLPGILQFMGLQPMALTHLDLSFNRFTHVEPVLVQFQNLQVLLMHGNLITNFSHLEILNRFIFLRNLTLHGNPVDRTIGFRYIIVSWLRQLKSLDFMTVTEFDRFKAEVWGRKWNVLRHQGATMKGNMNMSF